MKKEYLKMCAVMLAVECDAGFLSGSMKIAKDEGIEINKQEGSEGPVIDVTSWD